MAQASGSPPGSLVTWVAMRAGRISASPSSSAKFSASEANAAISRICSARLARGQLDELPFLVGAVRAGLDIEVGQYAQQSGADVDALATRERHQPVETRKQWRCGHLGCTRLVETLRRQPTPAGFKSWLRKTSRENDRSHFIGVASPPRCPTPALCVVPRLRTR